MFEHICIYLNIFGHIWIFRSCALPPTLFPLSWLDCSWRMQERRHASLPKSNTCRVIAATNFQESYLAVDWLAVGSILVHRPAHCKEMQPALWRVWASNLCIYLYSVKWTSCFSALLSLNPHVKRRCCLKSTVYSPFTHVVNRTRTVLLGFSNVNQWH